MGGYFKSSPFVVLRDVFGGNVGEFDGVVVHSVCLGVKKLLDSIGMFCTEEEKVHLPVVTDVVPMLTVILLDLAPGLRVNLDWSFGPFGIFLARGVAILCVAAAVFTKVGLSPVVTTAAMGGEVGLHDE